MLQSRPFVMAMLGIDIGTGGSRAVIVNDAGRVLVSSTQAHVPFDHRFARYASLLFKPETLMPSADQALFVLYLP